jgi:hypothetical protein
MTVAIYTAIYGGYETPKPLKDLGVPAYLYTDNPSMTAPGWDVRVVRHFITTLKGAPGVVAPMLAHKWWKCHPEVACPEATISMWIDGSMEIWVDDYVERALDALGEDDWACVPHPARRCIYPEANFSATLARYDAPSINAQSRFYRDVVGHPPNWGLVATGANVRRHTPEVIDLGQQWWDECINWSHQDQLSLPVLFRLNEGKIKWNMKLPWHQWWHLYPHG